MATAQERDQSISPMTKAARPSTPTDAESPSTFALPKPIESVLPPTISTPSQQRPDVKTSTTEARDYWNGGSPHTHPLPAISNSNGKDKALPPAPYDVRSTEERPATVGDQNGQDPSAGVPRRSVQFARGDADESPIGHTRHGSLDDPDTPKSRGGSFMSKLKAFTATTPKSQSTAAFPDPPEPRTQLMADSPTAARFGARVPDTLAEEQSDADADAEETADEMNLPEPSSEKKKKKKRKMRRPKKANLWVPPARFGQEADVPSTYNRLLRRRASMPDTSGHVSEGGAAEDEFRQPPFRRGNSWMNSSMRPPGEDIDELETTAAVGRRTGHLRRITVFGGGGLSDGDALTPRRPFFNSERASTYGAHKWKQVKSTLKLLRQKKEDRFDYYKSAELMAELRAGAPAVLMLASMIQRDEHGNKRIPVLLEQLKLTIRDSTPQPDDEKERHWNFTMDLEYGSGPSRMGWTVVRTIRDIYNLHLRYKFALRNEKYLPGRHDHGARPKQPKFPYSAFPYLRKRRDKGDRDDSDDDDQASIRGDETAGEGTAGEGAADGMMSDIEGPQGAPRKKSRMNLLGMRRRSTGITDPGDLPEGTGLDMATRRQRYVEKQRRILEKYLSETIRWLMFRADSNRLCRFLELSALGVRLAAEGSYHGKEGYLHIQSSKGLDFRRVLTPAKVIARHSRKWFLVRQSYIVCVGTPENMNIYDVYLVDSKFSIVSKRSTLAQIGSKDKKTEFDLTVEAPPEKHHTLTLHTSERKVRLFSGNQSVMRQFEGSIAEMLKQTAWYEKKRFDSFSPVRTGVFAQWLVDGRDYMWNVSRAINMAKDVIYIHDWWLSPELYMRRPAAISQKWRLDRLLQKKAREGVKIFIIIYRNVEAAIPIDSEYTKFSLLNLHPNIFVQRSPNQFKKNQFFFAHHEKICVVDHDVAFVGGIDLCFGRWDCPQHPIVDDKPTGFEQSQQPKDAEHCQLFPGKDYSNPRVQDFFRLNEPYEEMYDRSKVPRMPWHDISMQVVGQPARDLTRHFIQRWNYLRRGRKPTRPLPFLLPPPDAKMEELEALGLTGTCEVQILRSASTWSLGIEETEHSIQTAYIKMIEDSEHFVYIENQFFISSTEIYNTRIMNRIGDALVDRIIRAYENDEDWRCTIVIPLMPGFQNTVDEQEGTSVRLILMCQYRSICRGEHSIFGRLRAVGIEPEDYINFYSLRQWGIMGNDALVTEQLYIHAKTIIVDDRVALIGSANINERSMLGSRDSECAAIVRDTDMIWSQMAGKPYRVGRFAHTLRLRLMREHLGLDVDAILDEERQQELDRDTFENEMDDIYEERLAPPVAGPSSRRKGHAHKHSEPIRLPSFNHEMDLAQAEAIHESDSSSSSASSSRPGKGNEKEFDPRVTGNKQHHQDVSGYGKDGWKAAEKSGLDAGRDSVIVNGREVLVHNVNAEGKGTLEVPKPAHEIDQSPDTKYMDTTDASNEALPPMPAFNRRTTEQLGLPRANQLPPLPAMDDTDIGAPPNHLDAETARGASHPMAADIKLAHIDKDCMRDPLDPKFMEDIWARAAQNNTKLYRRVFRCMPDSEVSTWAEYREFRDYGEKFKASMDGRSKSEEPASKPNSSHQPVGSTSAAPGIGAPGPEAIAKAVEKEAEQGVKNFAHALSPQHHGEEKPTLIMPDEGRSAFNEKQPAPSEGGEPDPVQKKPTLDIRTGTNNQHQMEAPSPVYSQGDTPFPALETQHAKFLEPQTSKERDRRTTFSTLDKPASRDTSTGAPTQVGSLKRRRRATTKGSRRGFTIDDMPSRVDAEELLKLVQGNIVQFPYDWLLTEEHNGNWGYQVDGVAPLAIYD